MNTETTFEPIVLLDSAYDMSTAAQTSAPAHEPRVKAAAKQAGVSLKTQEKQSRWLRLRSKRTLPL
jgi:hypothetical protein